MNTPPLDGQGLEFSRTKPQRSGKVWRIAPTAMGQRNAPRLPVMLHTAMTEADAALQAAWHEVFGAAE